MSELRTDIKEYTRKLKVAEHFYKESESDTESEENIVRNKSFFNPKNGKNDILNTVCDTLNNLPLNSNINNCKTKFNLSREETTALESLANDESIVIKEADKGGAVVIMDSGFYKDHIMKMLSNVDYYQEIPTNDDKKTMQKIKNLLKRHKTTSCLTEKEEDYLTDYEYKESNFYGLPKIHKSTKIKDAIKVQCSEYIRCPHPDDITFRPIVGGPSAPTQRLSNLLDILLKPLCTDVKSYVKDDLDFLRHLPEKINKNSKFITFDVINLYSNISNSLGLNAMEYWINRIPEKINNRFLKEFILEAAEIVLTNNTFTFNGKHFKQIKGTAMGTKMAPTYATLTLGYLEEKMYKEINRLFNEETEMYITKHWKRYLDDCFIVWNSGDNNLSVFKNILNELNPDIKFTADESLNRISFLDILLTKQDEVIMTDVYYKPTDTHQYLHFNSCHPRHTKRAIPYNLSRRICTIVNDDSVKIQRLQELKKYLKKQSYPDKIIDDAIEKTMKLDRKKLLNPVQNNNKKSKILPLVTTHNPRNTNIAPIVHHLNGVLKTDNYIQVC